MKSMTRLVIVLPALLLAVLEVFHPTGHRDAVLETLQPQVERWLVVHYLQLLLFPLTALSVYQLTANYQDTLSRIAGIAMAVYAIGYCAYDSIAGIGTGILISDANELRELLGAELPESYDSIMTETIQAYYHSPIADNIAWVAIVAAICGLLLTGVQLYRRGHGALPLFMLAGAAWGVTKTHAPPYGPITFGFIFVAAMSVVFFSPKRDEVLAAASSEQPA